MRKNFILSIFIVLSLNISAQQLPQLWIQTFQAQGKASDRIAAITTDNSGNVFVAGYAGNHHGAPDAFAMKLNAQGDTLWVYYYDGGENNEDYATDIAIDNSGNTYITGHSQGTTAFFDCFTAMINPNGVLVWATRYAAGVNAQSYGNALAVDVSGNVYVAGYTDPPSSSNDWLVLKYNSSGIEQWVDILNGPGSGGDQAIDVAIAPNGNPTVCGYVYDVSGSGGTNAYVKQYTPINGTAWTDSWSHPTFTGTDMAYGIGFTTAGDAFVGGETMNGSTSNNDAFAMRYDLSGNRQWATIYTDASTNNDEYIRDVAIDNSGNIYFTGTDYTNGYVTKINSNGTNGWRKTWNGPLSNGSDVFHSIAADPAGNVYATGRGVYPGEDYYGNGGLPNMIIAKYNSSGDSIWTYRCADSLNSSMGFAITVNNGIVYAGGFVTDTAYVNENLYTLGLDTSGTSLHEWIYNGRGDAITMGQFVKTDAGGNIYCGATIDRLYSGGNDLALVKYDPAGNLLWEKYYSSYGWNNDTLTAMEFDPAGNLILCLSTDSALLKNNYKLTLLKSDQNGNFIDTNTVSIAGNLLAQEMVIRNDGAIALTVSSGSLGGLLTYFDASLNLSWYAKVDSTPFAATRANSLALFPNGDLAVGGFSQTSSTTTGLVQRYDALGNKLWTINIDSSGVYDEVRNVTVNSSGDVFFTGASGLLNSYTAMIGMIDGTSGQLSWRQVYNPNSNNEHGVKVRATPAGNVVFICRGWSGSVARYYTVQYSGTGTFQWANAYNLTASDREPVDLLVEANNRVVTAGWEINGFTTNYDYVLAGYTGAGVLDFTNTYSGTITVSFSWDQLRCLASDVQGDFIVTGQSSWEFYNNFLYKMVTIKYGGTPVGNTEISGHSRKLAMVFPNPSASGKFTLRNTAPEPIISGHIYNMEGKLIGSINPEIETFDLRDVPDGLYVLVLERKDFRKECIRLSVQK